MCLWIFANWPKLLYLWSNHFFHEWVSQHDQAVSLDWQVFTGHLTPTSNCLKSSNSSTTNAAIIRFISSDISCLLICKNPDPWTGWRRIIMLNVGCWCQQRSFYSSLSACWGSVTDWRGHTSHNPVVATAKSAACLCRDHSLQLHAMFSLTVCSMSRIRLRHGHLSSVKQH